MQLPFAVIPLIHFTNNKQRMGAFANRAWVRDAGVDDCGADSGAERLAGDPLHARLAQRRRQLGEDAWNSA